MSNSNFYWAGRYFNTVEEMDDYIKKWPNEQLDLEEYRKFLEQRWQEAKTNLEMRGSLTNREAYALLNIYTHWAKE